MNIIKKVGIILLLLVLTFAAGLGYLNKNPMHFSVTNFHYGDDVIINSSDLLLKFSNYKIILTTPALKITKTNTHNLNLSDVILAVDAWLLTSNFSAKINKAEIIPLISEDYAKHNQIVFDGTVNADFLLTKVMNAEVTLSSNDGWNDPKLPNLSKIKLQECLLSLNYSANKLSIKEFKLQYENGISAFLVGDFVIKNNNLKSATFSTEINTLPISYLKNLWPEILFPKMHNWVNTNISDGMINKAQGSFNFTEEGLKNANLSQDSIKVEMDVSHAKVKYLDGYNPITNVNAKVKFDGNALYVNADKAVMLGNELSDIELMILFKNFTLSLKTKFIGNISALKEFIPEKVHKRLNIYGIDFASIKGRANGELTLKLPIVDQFALKNLALDIKADVSDVALGIRGLIKIKKARVELVNSADNLSLKINDSKAFIFNLSDYHDEKRAADNLIELAANIELSEPLKITAIELNSGVVKVSAKINKDNWQTNIDLTGAEAYMNYLGYTKPIKTSFNMGCNGKMNTGQFSEGSCFLQGEKDFSGQLKFNYDIDKGQLESLSIDNAKIANNKFSFKMISDNDALSYFLKGTTLDISNLKFGDLVFSNKDSSNFRLSFDIGKLLCKNNVSLDSLSGSVSKNGNNPLDINIKAISGADRFTLSKAIKNGQSTYVLHSKSAATFSQAFNIYNNIKKGELWAEASSNKVDSGIEYKGQISLNNFAFTNTSVFSKIVLGVLSPLHSLGAVIHSFQGGSIVADNFTANLDYQNGVLTMKDGYISGPSYAIKIGGYIDFSNHMLKFKGIYIPYLYGINKLVSSIPILGNLIDGGKKSALIGANFTIRGDINNPEINFNPLSLLTPGFLRNIL